VNINSSCDYWFLCYFSKIGFDRYFQMGVFMKKLVIGATLVALASSGLSAQTDGAVATAAEVQAALPQVVAQPQLLTLAAGTPITLAVTEEVNTSTHKEGDSFKLTVLNDVSVGQTVVIPRGTPATADITWRTGKGAFGKSGKMEFELRSLDLDGKQIPLNGSFRQEGEGNTIATGVGVIAIGIFAGFITGKRARLPVGRELMSQSLQAVPFTADGKLSSSFDADAAMKAAATNTPFGKCKAAAQTLSNAKKQEKALEECFAERMD
jgi:hypothetical protein